MTTLANYMHSIGLGWFIKNPDDTGDSYAADMEPLADAVLTEQCNEYSSCSLLSAYEATRPSSTPSTTSRRPTSARRQRGRVSTGRSSGRPHRGAEPLSLIRG